MIEAFIVSSILLILGILALGYRVFFIKNGEFPNIHIGGNQGLKNQGISCATTQDRSSQQNKSYTNNEVYNEINQF